MSEQQEQQAPKPQGGSQSPPKETPAPVAVSPGGPENRVIQLSHGGNSENAAVFTDRAPAQAASTPAPKPPAPTQPSGPPQNVPETRETPKPSKK